MSVWLEVRIYDTKIVTCPTLGYSPCATHIAYENHQETHTNLGVMPILKKLQKNIDAKYVTESSQIGTT